MARTQQGISNDSSPSQSAWPLASAALALATLFFIGSPLVAQLGGEEIWYDGPSEVDPGNAEQIDVDVDDLGRALVTWIVPGDGGRVYVRRVDYDGSLLEEPILVAETAIDHRDPRVAASSDGDFLVVWTERNSARGITFYDIRSRHYDASGQPTASEQIVNVETASFSGGAHFPDVAALTGGEFVVVWRSASFAGSADANTSIQGRLVDNSGVPYGGQFQVNVETSGSQSYPRVDGLPADDPDGPYDGGFVAAWTVPDIHLRRFDASGVGESTDQLVNGNDDGERLDLAAQQYEDRIAVTWYDSSRVLARIFTGDLDPVASTLQVSGISDTDADDPTLTDIGRDGFYVAWSSATGDGNDDSSESIQARILNNEGGSVGAQFQVNTWVMNGQTKPALGSSIGRLIIAWRSSGQSEVNPGGAHALGYLLDYCVLFCDDFESGNLVEWSALVTP